MAAAAKPAVRERRDVEWLVTWALVDNGLGAEFTGAWTTFSLRELGIRVALGGGWAGSGPKVQHDDAWRIAEGIARLPADAVTGEKTMTELVVRYGRTNCRPDWCEEGIGHLEPKTNKRGQVEYEYERPGDRKSRKIGPKLVWVGETEARIEWYRAQYAVWWIALKCLVEPLNEVLTRFEATGPRAPEEPWTSARVFGPDGRVVMGLHKNDASARLARLARRGPIEIERPREGSVQAVESAVVHRPHGRS